MGNVLVYVFGTDHRLQKGDLNAVSDELVQSFKERIQSVCSNLQIKIVFEEWFSDGFWKFEVGTSIIQRVFENSEPAVCHIDLNEAERILITCFVRCINERHDPLSMEFNPKNDDNICPNPPGNRDNECVCAKLAHEIRERVWVARIRETKTWPALFVCGADHVESIHSLLNTFGVKSEIIEFDYGKLPR